MSAFMGCMCVREMSSRLLHLRTLPATVSVGMLPNRLRIHNSNVVCRTLTSQSCCKTRQTKSLADRVRLTCFASPWAAQAKLFSQKVDGTTATDPVLQAATSDKDKEGDEKGKGDSKKKSGWFSPQNAWKLGLLSLGAFGLCGGGFLLLEWGAPIKDPDGNELPDEFTNLPKWQQYPKRARKELKFFVQSIQDPSREKLLPDPLKEPYHQPPYTLVLEMTGVLVHPDWTLGTGWRFKKRPAVDYFLQQVAPPLFEVVIYTSEQGFTAWPIIEGLDPQGIIMYRLFRDATRYKNGHHVKDLACLNRDLSKVIIVDCDPNSYALHPRNAVGMMKWTGNDDDRKLVDLASFLRMIAISGVEDVRDVLDHYNQFDDPLEAFKENQQKLVAEQDKTMQSQPQAPQTLTKNWGPSLFGKRR